jgi:hypothetical protein
MPKGTAPLTEEEGRTDGPEQQRRRGNREGNAEDRWRGSRVAPEKREAEEEISDLLTIYLTGNEGRERLR